MGGEDKLLFSALFSGLIGAALAAPKPEERQALAEYEALKKQVQLRKESLGQLPDIPNLSIYDNTDIYNLFSESYRMYLYGFSRAASVFAVATIEHVLRKKYPAEKNFFNLIGMAEKEGVIKAAEKSYLDGLRMDRNQFIHNLAQPVSEDDARFVLRLTMRILQKIV